MTKFSTIQKLVEEIPATFKTEFHLQIRVADTIASVIFWDQNKEETFARVVFTSKYGEGLEVLFDRATVSTPGLSGTLEQVQMHIKATSECATLLALFEGL